MTGTEPKIGDIWYRVQCLYWEGYEDGSFYDDTQAEDISIIFQDWHVDKITPKGLWLVRYPGLFGSTKKFILLNSIRKHAYPTKEEAIAAFKKRKVRQIQILEWQLQGAKEQLEALKIKEQNEH